MIKKGTVIISDILSEIECMGSYEEKAEKAYIELTENKSLSDADREKLFMYIKKVAEHHESEEVVGAWCFLGDCYNYGIGCKKSINDAILAYSNVIDKQGSYAEQWRSWAASKLGNIYIDQKKLDDAKLYIHMSASPEDYERLASQLWKDGDERAALEDYKKAGDYGRTEAYKKAVEKCLSSHDTGIKERAVEFARDYFTSDVDKNNKQKVADKIMDYFYKELHEVDPDEKERLKRQFDRFKNLLDDNSLKKKDESKPKKFWRKNGGTIKGTGISFIGLFVYNRVFKK